MSNSEGSSSAATKRSRQSRSNVWEVFEKLPMENDGTQMAKCINCGQVFVAGGQGTSSMIRHRTRCQPNAVEDSEVHGPLQPLDQEKYREKLALSIIQHNYPFKYVEHERTRDLHSFLHPDVIPITRNTARSDVTKIYMREKENLKSTLELIPGRICFTTDLWTSLVTDGYMTLTAHYVDQNWVLQKKILIFRHVPPPHNGPILAEKVISYFKEWGIEKKIFTITLDNAKYNDRMVGSLKDHLSLTNDLICGGEFLHVRCGAHVLNLIVQAGLKIIDDSIYKIRESVKYVRGSEARKMKFAECIAHVSINCSRKVHQDLPTRWNSTYLMIESALVYRRAFSQLQLVDLNFKTCPSNEEWAKAEEISRFLKPFFEITTLFSGSSYPTSNLYFQNIWKIQLLLVEESKNPDVNISRMAFDMKNKFDKYWECYSGILSLAIVLDPRYKLKLVEYCFSKLDAVTTQENVSSVRRNLYSLFEEYTRIVPSTHGSSSVEGSSAVFDNVQDEMDDFDLFESQLHGSNRNKSQLDIYLDEPLLDRKANADLVVLDFWKVNRFRFPELSLMARDILSIPITTVASESAFSTGGRIIDKYRSSLLPKNVEALLCTRDWLSSHGDISSDEEDELEEDFEKLVSQIRVTSLG